MGGWAQAKREVREAAVERPGAEAPALSCRPWSLRARRTELARAIRVCTPAPGPRLGSRSSFPGHRGALGPSSHRPGLGTGPQRPQRCPLVRPWERGPHARQPCPSAWPKQPRSQPAGGSRSRGARRAVGARRGAAGLCTDSSRRQGGRPGRPSVAHELAWLPPLRPLKAPEPQAAGPEPETVPAARRSV